MTDDPLRALWFETLGDRRVCIAVLDGPVDLSHPCFAGAEIAVLETLASQPADAGFAAQHGTHVASLLFGQPGTAVPGAAPGCRGLIVPVYQGTPDGGVRPCSQLDLARGIVQAVASGANIINISGGQPDPSGQADPLLAAAIQQCADSGVLVVAAAGNDGCACLHVPAAVPSVLVVGAMDAAGDPLELSNWAESYQERGVLANGKDVLGAGPGGTVFRATGTSFAVPRVSGVAALLLSVQRKRGDPPDVRTVRRAILETAINCDEQPASDCRRLLAGRLNPVGALNYIAKGNASSMSEPIDVEEPQVPVGHASSVRNPELVEPSAASASQVAPSACGCAGAQEPMLVYAIGQIQFDFGTEANRDCFIQLGVNPPVTGTLLRHLTGEDDQFVQELVGPKPALEDERQCASYRKKRRVFGQASSNWMNVERVIWVLYQDDTPIYAIRPAGPFAATAYSEIVEFLEDQENRRSEMISVPGQVVGKTRLLNGIEVPVLYPDPRGMFNWSRARLVQQVWEALKPPATSQEPAQASDEGEGQRFEAAMGEFLDRVYFERRNLGVTSQERALNYAATNLFQVAEILTTLGDVSYRLDTIEVERSSFCRPGSDCWDVKLIFFKPARRLEEARKVFRFTVDVSQVIPVTVGTVRSWLIN